MKTTTSSLVIAFALFATASLTHLSAAPKVLACVPTKGGETCCEAFAECLGMSKSPGGIARCMDDSAPKGCGFTVKTCKSAAALLCEDTDKPGECTGAFWHYVGAVYCI